MDNFPLPFGPMSETDEELSFDAALEQLEAVVAKLESGDVGLEDAVALFEQGQKYLATCTSRLEQIERRIEEIISSV